MLNTLEQQRLKKYVRILRFDHFYLYGFGIFLCSLSYKTPLLFLLLIYFLYRFKAMYHLVFMMILLACSFFIMYVYENIKLDKTFKDKVVITNIYEHDTYQILTVKHKLKKYQAFVFNGNFECGDIVFINGEFENFYGKDYANGFNEKRYNLSQNIIGKIRVNEIYLVKQTKWFELRNGLINYVNTFDEPIKSYFNAFILNQGAAIDEVYHVLNLTHLLNLTGIQIYTLIYIVRKILFYFNVKPKTQDKAKYLILSLLMLILNGSLTILRILIYEVLKSLNKYLKLDLPNYNLLHITFIILLFIRPYYVFNVSFYIVFVILNFIHLFRPMFNKLDVPINSFLYSFMISLILIPFTQEISIFSFLLMPILIIIVSLGTFFVLIIVLIFPFLQTMLSNYIIVIERLLNLFYTYNHIIKLPKLSKELIVLYVILLVLFLSSKHIKHFLIYGISLVVLVCLPIFKLYISPYVEVSFLNVGQGDTAVINHQSCTIVVDSYNYSYAYLQNKGIREIDYLILSHSDLDHTKEAQKIINELHVKTLVLSKYVDYDLKHPITRYIKSDDLIKCGIFTLHFFGPIRPYNKVNDNSLVFKLSFFDKSILFTGDIETESEMEILARYKDMLQSDILKVSHHGSITSTHEAMLKMIKPMYGIISYGNNNTYGFPNQIVKSRLKTYKAQTYETALEGTITFQYTKKRYKVIKNRN